VITIHRGGKAVLPSMAALRKYGKSTKRLGARVEKSKTQTKASPLTETGQKKLPKKVYGNGMAHDPWKDYKLKFETYNETKKHRTHIHTASRDLWVRTCDSITHLGKVLRDSCRWILRRKS